MSVLPPGALMLDLQGTTLTDEEVSLLQHPQVGGVILFARNIETPEQVSALTAQMREVRPGLLIAVDQEGGRVQRLKSGFTKIPPMYQLGKLRRQDSALATELAGELGWLLASEVLAVGIDFSFAPVLDLRTELSQVIGDRGFDGEPDDVITLASAFLRGMREAGMSTTGKHFPGHGSVEADSHLELPVDHRELIEICERDLQPFRQCMPLLDGIMPAHVQYVQADSQCAGFSRFWLQTVLRQELGFDGVIFSDDLDMAAAVQAGSVAQRLAKALDAGCDMVLVCNNREAAKEALEALEQRQQPINPRLPSMRRATENNASLAELATDERAEKVRAAIIEHLQ